MQKEVGRVISVKIPEEVYKKIKALAAAEDRSMAKVVIRALTAFADAN